VIVFRVLLKFVWSHRPLFGHSMRGDTSKPSYIADCDWSHIMLAAVSPVG
jgi:hypothetical protein